MSIVRPKLVPGSIAVVGDHSKSVSFQYNPKEVTRTVEPQMSGGDGDRSNELRFTGAAKERIDMTLIFDAADGLNAGHPATIQYGVGNRLAQLQLLAYPEAKSIGEQELELATGVIEIIAEPAPLTVLDLGALKRPVKLQGLTITESEFDQHFNPTHATAQVSLHVLSYDDVEPSSAAYAAFLVYQAQLSRSADTVSLRV